MYIADNIMLSRVYLNETGKPQPAEYHLFQPPQEDQPFKNMNLLTQQNISESAVLHTST